MMRYAAIFSPPLRRQPSFSPSPPPILTLSFRHFSHFAAERCRHAAAATAIFAMPLRHISSFIFRFRYARHFEMPLHCLFAITPSFHYALHISIAIYIAIIAG
jgi:hypothetical protein